MTTTYTTITSKGQITLPVEVRRALNLRAGQKLAVRVEGDHVVIDPPHDVAALRGRIRAEAERRGTWDRVPHAGDGWTARARDVATEAADAKR